MAFTQSDLDHLDRMIVENVLESETADGKRVKFGSWSELKRRRDFVAKALRGSRGPRVGYVEAERES